MVLFDILVAQFVLFLERLDNAVGLLRYDVAPTNNLLSLLHHTAGQCYARQQVVLAAFATFTVVGEVGRDILVKVAFLQNGTYRCQFLVLKQLLIRQFWRVEVCNGDARGLFVVDDAYHRCSIAQQFSIVFLVDDALVVKA